MERASEELDGAAYLLAMRELEKLDPQALTAQLHALHQSLVTRSGLRFHIGGTAESVAKARPYAEKLIQALPEGSSIITTPWPLLSSTGPEALVVNAPVNFTGLATRLPLEGAATHYSHFLARRLLNNDYLWEQVRMQGGAYGCSSSFSHLDGRFVFSSYRDPHIKQSLDIYRKSGAWLKNLHLDETALEQAKIGSLGKMNPPELPSGLVSKTFFRHLIGLSYEQRLLFWEELHETRLSHIHAFGDLLDQSLLQQEYVCVLGGLKAITESTIPFHPLPMMG
jgi:Zn-dependent M16 (insulinase) family peptidase